MKQVGRRMVLALVPAALSGCFSIPYAHLGAAKDSQGTQRFGYTVNSDFADEYGGFEQAVEAALPVALDAKGLCPDGWVLTGSREIKTGRVYKGYCK